MAQSTANVAMDPLFKAALGIAAFFIVALIAIELGRDDAERAAVGTAGAPMSAPAE